MAQQDVSKQFWITESGTSSVDAVTSGTCSGNSDLGDCIDQGQVLVLGNLVNNLMHNHLFDVAIIYAVSPGAGGTLDPAYNQYLPPGMSVNDYGFQLLRSDGVTLRPMFSWLIQRNRCINQGGHFATNWSCQY